MAQENIKDLTDTQKELSKLRAQAQKLEKRLELSKQLGSFHDSCKYIEKISDLNKSIMHTT